MKVKFFYIFLLSIILSCKTIIKLDNKRQVFSEAYYHDFDFFKIKGINEIANPKKRNKLSNYVVVRYDKEHNLLSAHYKNKIRKEKRIIKSVDGKGKYVSTLTTPSDPYLLVDTITVFDNNTFFQHTYEIGLIDKKVYTDRGADLWVRHSKDTVYTVDCTFRGVNKNNYKSYLQRGSDGDNFYRVYCLQNNSLSVTHCFGKNLYHALNNNDRRREGKVDIDSDYFFRSIIEVR